MKKILFRIDYNNDIGGGHLQRCRLISDNLKNFDKFFFIQYKKNIEKKNIEKVFKKKNKNIFFFKNFNIKKEINLIKKFLDNESVILFDIANSEKTKIKEINKIKNYINNLSLTHKKIFFIDSLDKENLLKKVKCNVKILLTPYAGAKKNKFYSKHLIGLKYFILKKKLIKNTQKKIKKKIENILVTAGQTDPKKSTLKFAKFFRLYQNDFRNIKLKFILGNGFQKNYIDEILKVFGKTSMHIRFIQNCTNLEKHIMWSDLAISSNGLTKYELASNAVPSMLFSFDFNSHKIHRYFHKLKSSIYLGRIQKLKDKKLFEILKKIDNDYKYREKISKKSKKILDGRGLLRILKLINN